MQKPFNMHTNTNRLNLPNMVDRQLKDTVVPTESYFNPLIITGKRKSIEMRPKKTPTNKTIISTSLNSIVASVHSKLKTYKPNKTEKFPTIKEDETNDKMPTKKAPEKKLILMPRQKFKSTTAFDPKSTFHYNLQQLRMPIQTKSIPQIKAAREIKSQQRLRRNVARFEDISSAVHQRRIQEVKKQKRILEDMLQQHQKLQRDRHSIAMEIQSMREHLSDIRNKLDMSLRKLVTSHTMSERNNNRPKRSQSASSRKLMQGQMHNRQRPISVDRRMLRGTYG